MNSRWLAAAVAVAACVPTTSWAQEGLATSSTIQGHNTIQQAPSGGRINGSAATGQAGVNNEGLPDSQERALEKHNSAATQICKGC